MRQRPQFACALLLATIFVAAQADENILWTNPGDPSKLDFQYGVGGKALQPQPPFQFIDEDESGATPKVDVVDGAGRRWSVKWGEEAKPSVFCTRLLWACGYYATPEYFIPSGLIEGAHDLHRAGGKIASDGSFEDARFQLRSKSPKHLDGQGWSWPRNPFEGTRELSGLKVLMMLVSNWDTKDSRDIAPAPNNRFEMDSNLAIFEDDSTGRRRYIFTDDDWGATLGKTGNWASRSKWNCKGFEEQTQDFVKFRKDGSLDWGFSGKHRKDMVEGISPSDIAWLLQYLGRITDDQIRSGLEASGATPPEVDCFTQNLRRRIEDLRIVATRMTTTAGAP